MARESALRTEGRRGKANAELIFLQEAAVAGPKLGQSDALAARQGTFGLVHRWRNGAENWIGFKRGDVGGNGVGVDFLYGGFVRGWR